MSNFYDTTHRFYATTSVTLTKQHC